MMRTHQMILGLSLLAMGMAGCGDDDDTGAPCPENVVPGGSISCACDDGGARGVQLCKPSKKLSECDCTDAIGGGAGKGGSGGSKSGGSSGSGGSKSSGSGGSTMSSGTGGSTMNQSDGGKPPVVGTDAGSPGNTKPPPMDGNQLSICMTGVDCNRGFDCYNPPAPGDGFCSEVCATDDDCMGVKGGTYVCSQSTGICVIDCMGADDTSCPMGMTCEQTFAGGFPGTGGQNGGGTGGAGAPPPTFRCGYAAGTGMPRAAAWAACMSPTSADCEMGLICNGSGAGMSGSGYCTQPCMNDNACSMKPSSGDVAPTCEPMRMGGGGPGGQQARMCILDCATNQDGCPDGMGCVTNMFFGTTRCEFQ